MERDIKNIARKMWFQILNHGCGGRGVMPTILADIVHAVQLPLGALLTPSSR
jgi:hypothetical protein